MAVLTHASLFSGIGGAELAAAWMGWKNAFHCEVNEYGLEVLRYWFPNSTEYNDITKTDFREWRGRIDVLTGGFPCFVAGTPVLTDRGLVPIEGVLPGDKALAADGRWHDVLSVMRHPADKAVRLRAQGMCDPLTCTPNHPFLARKVLRSGHAGGVAGYAPAEYVPASELRKGDKVGYVTRRGENTMKTPKFWRLVGTWLADGWTSEGRRADGHGYDHKVMICCGKSHIARLHHTVQGAGYRYTLSEDASTYRAIICDKWLCEFLHDFGKLAHGKRLAPVCFELDDDRKRALFEGWMCDGYTDERGAVRVTTVSRELAEGMARIARDIYHRPVSLSRKTVNRECVIEGRAVNERPQYCLTVPASSRYGFYEDGIVWCNVKKVETLEEDNIVYNLEVEDEHSYTAYGLAVHNCQPFSTSGLRKGADDERYLWPEMCRAIEEVQPRYVVGENVAGLLTMVEPISDAKVGKLPSLFGEADDICQKREWYTIDRVCGDLAERGYAVQPVIIPALAVGAPHRRDRVWILAKRVADADGDGLQGRMLEAQEAPAALAPVEPHARDIPRPGFEDVVSQPPLCGGDDGLPVGLADAPIYKGRESTWVREAVKALGNAWCPQVAYEIFRAIDEDAKEQNDDGRQDDANQHGNREAPQRDVPRGPHIR